MRKSLVAQSNKTDRADSSSYIDTPLADYIVPTPVIYMYMYIYIYSMSFSFVGEVAAEIQFCARIWPMLSIGCDLNQHVNADSLVIYF